MQLNIHDAKTHFSQLINQVLNGEEVIIARGGQPVVRMVIYNPEQTPRPSGQFKGLMTVSEDFDAPLPEDILKLFYGNEE